MGLFDGAFGGNGQGILPEWLFNPQYLESQMPIIQSNQPTPSMQAQTGQSGIGMTADMPFANRWSPVSQAVDNWTIDPRGANNNASYGMPQQQMAGSSTQTFPNGDLPIPQPRPAAAQEAFNRTMITPGGELPPEATPTAGTLPSGNPISSLLGSLLSGSAQAQGAPQGTPQGGPGFGDRLAAGGAGFFNARSPMEAIGNLIGGAATGQRQDPQGQAYALAQQARVGAYQAVKAAGGTEGQALAAASNPEVFKAIAPELFSGWKIVKTGSNPVTGDQFMMQGPGGQLRPLDSFVKGGSPGGGQVGSAGMLASGVKQYDPNLTGDDYLGQFSPEVQSAVKAYIKGDVLPTGNPRLQSIANAAKTIAQKYGQDTGQPVSDALYSEKRKYRTELGSTSPSSAGGQAKSFTQGIEHALALGGELKKLENWNGFGIPLVAATANTIRQGMSNEQSAIADKAAGIGQTLAGEVGKLFSGSAGGGVHEREMTRARFSTVRSRPQLAAALEATLETMEGGLTALEARRDSVMGPNSGVELIPQQTRDKVEQLRGIIAELKGQSEQKSKPGVVKWEVGPNGVPRPVSK